MDGLYGPLPRRCGRRATGAYPIVFKGFFSRGDCLICVFPERRPGRGIAASAAKGKGAITVELAGGVDPTKVVRIALENAVSVASILLLTEATMTELPEKEKPLPAEAAEY